MKVSAVATNFIWRNKKMVEKNHRKSDCDRYLLRREKGKSVFMSFVDWGTLWTHTPSVWRVWGESANTWLRTWKGNLSPPSFSLWRKTETCKATKTSFHSHPGGVCLLNVTQIGCRWTLTPLLVTDYPLKLQQNDQTWEKTTGGFSVKWRFINQKFFFL